MICSNCKNEFEGKNFGVMSRFDLNGRRVHAGKLLDLCSTICRTEFRSDFPFKKPGNAGSGVGVRNAEPGVTKPKRKPTPSEIRKALRPHERDISRAIGQALTDVGIWNTRTQSGQVRTSSGHNMNLCRPGTPDRIVADGFHIWIEVKRPGEKPSAEQVATLATLRSNGALAFVVDDPAELSIILKGVADSAGRAQIIKGLIMATQIEINNAIAQYREGK
jgi:hypothetical protein